MTSDQLTGEQKARSDVLLPNYWRHHGWGFGVAVATGPRAQTLYRDFWDAVYAAA